MIKNWEKYGIRVPAGRGGKIKMYCPQCHDSRTDKRDKSLSVNLDEGWFRCHYCGFSGNVCEEEEWERQARRQEWFNSHPLRQQKKEYKKPAPHPEKVHAVSEKALKWFESRGISKETVEAMKITEGMEWMPQKDKEANTVQFNYYRNGELINTKFRTGDKCFKMVSGAELLPYNIDGIAGEKECIVTEGEMDALSFFEVGYRNVVSVPNGANANLEWLDDYMEAYFDDKEVIYVAADGDTKGEILRQELVRRFGAERCRVVEYIEGCKDANEVMMKYGKEAVKSLVTESKYVKIDGVFAVSDFETSLDKLYREGMQKGVTIGHENFDSLCTFETKKLCVVTGLPSCLSPETIITMADGGQKRIKDVSVGDMVVTYTDKFEKTVRPVLTKWDCGNKDICVVSLQNGMSIKGSTEHRYMTFDGWKRAEDLKAGDYVMIDSETCGYDKPLNTDIVKLLALWIADGNKNNCSYMVVKPQEYIGDMLRDICERNNLHIKSDGRGQYIISTISRLTTKKKEYIPKMSYYYRQKGYGFEKSVKMAKKQYEKRINDKDSVFNPVDELKKFGVWGLKTSTIEIPEVIFRQPNEVVRTFLNTLYAGDGWVCDREVGYSSNSKSLCIGVQTLLMRFGIKSYVREKRVKYNGDIRLSYTVEISSREHINLFMEKVGVLGKGDGFKPLEGMSYRSSDFVPRSALLKLAHGTKFYKKYHGIALSKDMRKQKVHRDIVRKCAEIEGNEELIQKAGVMWECVKSVEIGGECEMYDLEIADTHCYMANGVLTHNSGKSEFIDEIAERLNVRYNWKWGFFSPENSPLSYHASKLIMKFTGKKFGADTLSIKEYEMAKKHLEKDFSFICPEDNFKIDTILEKAKVLVRRKGIKGLVIDPYNRIESAQGSMSETQYISQVLDKLINFAKINDVLVILMAHPTKLKKNNDGIVEIPTQYDISGSAHFFNKEDYGLAVHRHRNNGDDHVEVQVQKVRFRHLGECGSAMFKYNLNNGRYVPYFGQAEIAWDNTNHLITRNVELQKEAAQKAVIQFDSSEGIQPNRGFENNTGFDDNDGNGERYGLPY